MLLESVNLRLTNSSGNDMPIAVRIMLVQTAAPNILINMFLSLLLSDPIAFPNINTFKNVRVKFLQKSLAIFIMI